MPVDNSPSSVAELLRQLEHTIDDVVSREELEAKLLSGRRLTLKYGVDLTAPLLHLGHAVNLWMYRRLQEYGHKVVLLLGDFTTRIGDPTGKSATRPVLSEDDIAANRDEILRQALTVLHADPEVFEVRQNSEWLEPLGAAGLLRLMSDYTVDRMLSRDMFRSRMEAGASIRLHELVYPLLQGWDSVALRSDITIVGSDQLFNEMIGRELQTREGSEGQVVVTTKITPGIDGKEKQSKSIGNYIALDHSAREKFGRLMSIPDDLVDVYVEVYADPRDVTPPPSSAGPMERKLQMAEVITQRWHGREIASAERSWFVQTFSNREMPRDSPRIQVASGRISALDVAAALAPAESKSQLRRLIADGALRVDGERMDSPDAVVVVESEVSVRLGKRSWAYLAPTRG